MPNALAIFSPAPNATSETRLKLRLFSLLRMPNALAIFFSCCWRHSYCCCCCWWPAAPPKSEPLPAANPTPSGKSPCQWRTEKLRNCCSCCSCAAAASFSKLTRNSKTPPNFVPKMTQNGSKKLPNVFSEIQENLRESQTINPGKSQTIYSTRCLLAAAQAWIPDWGSCRAAVVVRNKTQMYYSLARSPLRQLVTQVCHILRPTSPPNHKGHGFVAHAQRQNTT